MARDYNIVDKATGEVLVRVRHLFPEEPVDCCMCEQPTCSPKCVPFYCEPVREGESAGGYKTACDACYSRWEKWNDSFDSAPTESLTRCPETLDMFVGGMQ